MREPEEQTGTAATPPHLAHIFSPSTSSNSAILLSCEDEARSSPRPFGVGSGENVLRTGAEKA